MSAPRRAALLAAALLAAAPPAAAAPKVVGVILPESAPYYEAATASFRQALAAAGLGPGQVEVLVQKPAADPLSWANAVRKFGAIDADLLVVFGDGLLQTACREKLRIPVGYGFVVDPGAAPCARTPANPAGTAAGAAAHPPLQALVAKARLMTEFTTVGTFAIPDDRVGAALAAELQAAGRELGFSVSAIAAARREDAAAALRSAPAPGLLLLPSCTLPAGLMEELLAVAADRRIPTVAIRPPRGTAAPLLALYPSPEEQGGLVGEVAAQILARGPGAAPPAPATPRRIELEINLPLARQLGVKLPMALLEAATKVNK